MINPIPTLLLCCLLVSVALLAISAKYYVNGHSDNAFRWVLIFGFTSTVLATFTLAVVIA